MKAAHGEQALIDSAELDGEGWAIPPDAEAATVQQLAD